MSGKTAEFLLLSYQNNMLLNTSQYMAGDEASKSQVCGQHPCAELICSHIRLAWQGYIDNTISKIDRTAGGFHRVSESMHTCMPSTWKQSLLSS